MGAVCGLALAGCPGSDRGVVACDESAGCKTNEVCHRVAKVCVQTCGSDSDCPSWAKRCAEYQARFTTLKICECETSLACNENNPAGTLICSSDDRVCVGP